jgi:hypothetical protein
MVALYITNTGCCRPAMSRFDTSNELELRDSELDAPALHSLGHPVIATANIVAAALVDILGPMFWAALIVLFVVAELSPN